MAVEEIMLAMGSQGKQDALDMFLASCRTVAEARGNPDFLRLGEEAVELVRKEHSSEPSMGSTSP